MAGIVVSGSFIRARQISIGIFAAELLPTLSLPVTQSAFSTHKRFESYSHIMFSAEGNTRIRNAETHLTWSERCV